MPHRTWWKNHKHLFTYHLKPFHAQQIDVNYRLAQHDDDEPYMFVMINLYSRKDDILKEFNELLRGKLYNKRGKPLYDGWDANFPLTGRPEVRTINKLRRTLEVYDEWMANQSRREKLTLWEIAKEHKLNPTHIEALDMGGAAETDARRKLTVLVRDYVKHAEKVIRLVEVGEFPVASKRKKRG